MITNIIIGKESFVTKALLRSINKAEVFSANNLDDLSLNMSYFLEIFLSSV